MSYQKDRDEFLALASREGLTVDQARALLRHANTIERLAVAQCNGDWPADNGERKTEVCECGLAWAPSSFKVTFRPTRKRVCPDCYASARVRAILPDGYGAIIGGDPRGCTLKITVPSGYTNDWGKEGLCVPARER